MSKTIYTHEMYKAIKALAENRLDDALSSANTAMDYALYKMMQPVTSYYVRQAQAIRMTVFMRRRYDRFVMECA